MKMTSKKRWAVSAHIVMFILSLCAIVPFLLLIISSFTDEKTALRNGYSFFPEKWSLDAYKYIFSQWTVIGRAYGVTIIVTVIGTIVGVLMAALLGYTLSKRDLPGRSMILFLVSFTMLFNGGLTSSYIIYTQIFHIKNTIFGLLIPNLLMNGYYVMMFRNYFENSLPGALLEAAKIDGASEIKTFAKIVIPLALPMFATVGLTLALGYWNDWTNGRYYLSTGSELQSIQTILNNINENIKFLQSNNLSSTGVSTADLPSATVRMAIAVAGILPILCAYPLFQKWFVRGITEGAVKE